MATVDNSIKISALSTATPPLLATDAIPVVQGGITKQIPAYAVQTNRVRAVIVTGINLNGTGDRTTISLSSWLSTGASAGKYRVTAAWLYDVSVSLSATAANALTIRTAATGGGSTIITSVTTANLQTLTAATKMFTATPSVTDYFTAATLYVNLTTGHATAATVSLYLQLTELV